MIQRMRVVCMAVVALLLILVPAIGLGDDSTEEPLTSPVIPGGTPSHRVLSCPPGYIANRVAYGGRDYSLRDEIRVEVCVTREGGIDTYAYLVTNLGFWTYGVAGETIGITRVAVPNLLGYGIVSHTEPTDWTYVGNVAGLAAQGWEMPPGDGGIRIGESEIFTISYEGPTGPGAGWASFVYDLEIALADADALDPAVVVQTLGPIVTLPETPLTSMCPFDSVAHDVAYGTTESPPSPGFGDVRVEECVTREGGVDTYTYTLTNMSYYFFPMGTALHRPLGIADFAVPNPSELEPLSVSSPSGWSFDYAATDEWHWSVEPTWDGSTLHGRLWLGQSAVFSFSVAGPTEDGPLEVRASAQSALLPGYLWDDLGASGGVTVTSTGPHRQLLGHGTGSGRVTDPALPLAGCPAGRICYDVAYGAAPSFGEVRVEECVTREGDVDTYTYTLTNLTYSYPHGGDLYGIGDFVVPMSTGVVPLSTLTPTGWTLDSAAADQWHWRLPSGSIGVLPGDSVSFAISVIGPTVDGPLELRALPQFPRPPIPTYYDEDIAVSVLSTGPQPSLDSGSEKSDVPPAKSLDDQSGSEACPDLTIESVDAVCECDWNLQQQYRCDVEAEVWVRNSGHADAGVFWIELSTDKSDRRKMVASLAAGESRRVRLTLSSIEASCPVDIAVEVDSLRHVQECNESNNALTEELCCQ